MSIQMSPGLFSMGDLVRNKNIIEYIKIKPFQKFHILNTLPEPKLYRLSQ